jgi:hypothetical protein
MEVAVRLPGSCILKKKPIEGERPGESPHTAP